jgi:Z1 domain
VTNESSRIESAWSPVRGDATDALGRYLLDKRELPDAATFDAVVSASISIVRECKPFTLDNGRRTGIVVGYVQSGKTISMTTVASLARDNSCRLVILLAGTTDNLLRQTARHRLRPYLAGKPDTRRAWRLHDTVDNASLDSLQPKLRDWVAEWKRADVPEDRKRPLFLTVMKNHSHLAHLRDLLRTVDLYEIPSLVIDDEADQAGLDTNAGARARGRGPNTQPSTTYSRIAEIRQALPNHTYLQYTATPQAPLLISLADMLSPDFAHVLEPGEGYTGGQAFFRDRPDLIREIPQADLFDPNAPPWEPPESLTEAMRAFFIGAAVGNASADGGCRSMLIHPSQRQADHDAFTRFAHSVKQNWLAELRLPEDDRSRVACIEDFCATYDDIRRTVADLPSFDEVLKELEHTLADTEIWKVNSEDGHEVNWDNGYSHILVGGEKLNRGYTVKGLTVTYMPRSPGGWNADTIQQRARFFGYKAGYIGFCRVYLNPDVADAYREYVAHEEDVRSQLRDHAGRPLKEWARAFLLRHRMNPTRTNVLSENVLKLRAQGWFRQSYPHTSPGICDANRRFVSRLIGDLPFAPHPEFPQHTCARVPLDSLFRSFIVEYGCFAGDSINWTAVRLWLGELLARRQDAECFVVQIQDGAPRKRSEDTRIVGRINQLFEGRRGRIGAGVYPGDERVRARDAVTIQLHTLTVAADGQPAVHNVPALALHLPDDFAPRDVVIQPKIRL